MGRERLDFSAVLAAVESRRFRDTALSGITDDSRAVTPGAIFVALKGHADDGHRHVQEAVARGARLVVCEHEVPAAVPTCPVRSGRDALSELAAAWYCHPSRRLRLVGITGTAGKTTTTWLTAAVLRAAGVPTGVVGTAGANLGGGHQSLRWTTPPPPILHGLLAAAVADGLKALVIEASAQGIAQARVADCTFAAAAITNLSREHGEYFADAQAYRQAKLRLFQQLGTQPVAGAAVLNAALSGIECFRAATRAVLRVEYGPGGDVRVVRQQSRGMDGTDLLVVLPGDREPLPVHLGLPGRHNVENALCAAAIGYALDLPRRALAEGLAAVRSVPGRLQEVRRLPWRVVVDYAHTPAELRGLLGLLRSVTAGRLVLVMGARGGRDRGKRPLMAAVAAAFCDEVVLTSDRPAGEDPQAAVEPMRRVIEDIGVPARVDLDRWRALETAFAGRQPGDCVVVAGKGDEPWAGDSEMCPGEDDVGAAEALLSGVRGSVATVR